MEKIIRKLSYRSSPYTIFGDFVALAALSISNAIDKRFFDEREKQYLQIIKKYEKEEVEQFPRLLGHLTMALEEGMSDALGHLYSSMELHNEHAGQFFTPYDVCRFMVGIQIDDGLQEIIKNRGFITVQEPAVGAGAMIIALADEFKRAGVNYQKQMHVVAVDIDIRAVHMAYVQFSLLHIPAVVIHGNTLSLEEWSHWYTPAHILGVWDGELRRSQAAEVSVDNPTRQETPTILEPVLKPVEQPMQLNLF